MTVNINDIQTIEADYFTFIKHPSATYSKFKERFSLAKSISTITFSSEADSEKSLGKKQCYSRAIKLCELWFSFEKFLHFLNEQSLVASPIDSSSHKPSLITDALASESGIADTVKEANETIEINFDTIQKKSKLKKFINYLHSKSDDRQKKFLNSAEPKVDNIKHKHLTIQEFLSIVYAIRNLHVHDGDIFIDAMGSFNLTKDFLDILSDLLEKTILLVWKKTLEKAVQKMEE